MSLRDKILQSVDIPAETVEVPEWGVSVEVRGMSGADRVRIFDTIAVDGEVKAGTLYVETVLVTAYDPETGGRVFDESDRTALMEKSAQAIDRLARVGLRLSGMEGEVSQDEAGARFPEES